MRSNIYYAISFLSVISAFAVFSILSVLGLQTAYSKNPEVSYLDVNNTDSVSKFSVAAWFKTSSDYKSDAFIVNKAGSGGHLNYGIWMTNAEKIRAGFETSSGKPMYATSPLSYSDGKWHFALVTYDGSLINLYLDGKMVDSEPASGTPDSGGNEPVRVGANSDNPNDYFVGNVDEVRVWKIALNDQQVFNANNGKFDTSGQVLYLDFSKPMTVLNETSLVNQTAVNATSLLNQTAVNATSLLNQTAVNATSIFNQTAPNNQSRIQTVNETAKNETGMQITNQSNFNELNKGKNETGTTNETLADNNILPTAKGQTVSVDKNGQTEITLVAQDADNDSIQFKITTDPSHGSLDNFNKEKGVVTYTPQKDYTGSDKFSFSAIDNKGGEGDPADVNIKVNALSQAKNETGVTTNETLVENQTSASSIPKQNNLPEAFDQSVTLDQDKHVDITLVADDKDKDQLQFAITADPSHGSLAKFDKDKGTVTYVPDRDYSGDDKFSFRATDINGGQSSPANVDIKVNGGSQANENQTNDNTNTNTESTKSAEVLSNETSSAKTAETNTAEANQPPKADAGNDIKVKINTEVKLDGGQSSDADGKIVSYKWEQTDGPSVNLDKANEQTATFNVPGSSAGSKLSFKLTVTDDKDASSSDAVTVQVEKVADNTADKTGNSQQADTTEQTSAAASQVKENVPPKADAGGDQKAKVNDAVKLDGGQSSDDDGKIVSYKWEQTDGPKVDLKNSDEKLSSFDVPDSAADKNLSFKLTVTDDKDASDSDSATVQVEQAPNIPPKADAGGDQKAKVDDAVKLDGGKSNDEDGKIVSYKWEQTDGPKVDLKNSDEKVANFDVPLKAADSKLSFKLTVADDKDASDSDNATVQVDKITEETQGSN